MWVGWPWTRATKRTTFRASFSLICKAVVKQIAAALANSVDATLDRHGLRPGDDEAIVTINNVAACAGAAGARGLKGL